MITNPAERIQHPSEAPGQGSGLHARRRGFRGRASAGCDLRFGARVDRRDIGNDSDLVADDDTTGFECLLPAQPELSPADRAAGLEPDTILSLLVFRDAVHGHL